MLLPFGEQTNGHSILIGLLPLHVCPRVYPSSRAATRPKTLNDEPGLRRPCTAKSNWENSKGRPDAITFTAPVWLSTMVRAPVGAHEWVSAYAARNSSVSSGRISLHRARFSS